jgi:hypothetical protein
VFENKLLRKIYRPKRGETNGERKRWHNESFHQRYNSPDIRKNNKMTNSDGKTNSVTYLGWREIENYISLRLGSLRERSRWKVREVVEGPILEGRIAKWMSVMNADLFLPRIESNGERLSLER